MTVDIVPLDLLGFELDKSVVQEQGGAGTDDLGEPGKTYRNPAGVALDFLACQDEMIARLKFYRLRRKLTDAHFRSGQVRHDRETAPRRAGGGPKIPYHLAVAGKVAVGEIEPGYVHARQQHLLHDLGRIGCGTNGADDFCFIFWKSHTASISVSGNLRPG